MTKLGRKIIKLSALTLGALAVAAFSPSAMASAQSPVDTIDLTTAMYYSSYLAAFAIGLYSALQWEIYIKQPGKILLKVPATYTVIALIFAAFPLFFEISLSTIWSTGAAIVPQS